MRFVGSLTLALSTLLGGVAVTMAQSYAPPATAGTPTAAPPETVQGSWISDDRPVNQQALPLRTMPGYGAPLPMGAQRAAFMAPTQLGEEPYYEQPMPPAPPGAFQPTRQGAFQPASETDGGPNGGSYGGEESSGDDEYGDGDGGGCDDGGWFGCDFFGGGFFDGHHRRRPAPHFGDLWHEVHSHRRIYVKTEYINMWAKGNRLPPLVTTSPIGTPQTEAGVLGLPTTSILYGDQRVEIDKREGGRLTAGIWLVDGEFLGLEGHYMALKTATSQFSAASTFSDGIDPDDIILARPFFNTILGQQDSSIIAFPGFDLNGTIVDLDGRIDIRTTSDIQSAGLLLRDLLWIDFTANYRVDFLAGYRFFRLNESLIVNDEFTTVGGLLAPTTFASTDQFYTNNMFNGAEIGFLSQLFRGRLTAELLTKVALGNNREIVSIAGQNSVTTLGATVVNNGGFLAEPSNIGRTRRDMFTVLPELNVNFKLDVTRNIRATIGYDFLWISNVVRSGNQVDLNIDPSQINSNTPATQPERKAVDSVFYLQGWTAGVEVRY